MSDVDTSRYDGTVERTADGGVIRFERHLAYPVRDVWGAITNPARLAAWWLPFDADITVDLREGGQDRDDRHRRRGDDDHVRDPARRAADAPRTHPCRARVAHALGSSQSTPDACWADSFRPRHGQGDRQLLRRRPAPRSPGSCRAWTVARPHGTGMPSRRRRRGTPTSASHRRLLRNTPPSKRERGLWSLLAVRRIREPWSVRLEAHVPPSTPEDMVNIEVSMTLAEAVDEFPHLARVRAPRAGLLLRPAHTRRRVWARRLGPGDRRRGARRWLRPRTPPSGRPCRPMSWSTISRPPAAIWEELPRITALLDKVGSVHGERHPELMDIASCFAEVRGDLEPHLLGRSACCSR